MVSAVSSVEGLDVVTLLSSAGPTTIVLFGLLALAKGWVVFSRELAKRDERIKELESERDEFKGMAFRLLDVGERITSSAEQRRDRP